MLIEDWKQAVDSNQLVLVLSTDMSKAFDSLSHSLTVNKLKAYGFGGRSLNLMRSFFDNRLSRVKMCDATSDWTKTVRVWYALKDRLSDPYYGTFIRMICHLMLKA